MCDYRRQCVVNSANKVYATDTTTSFTVNLPTSLFGNSDFKTVSLLSANIPISFYNVRTGVNDQIVWNNAANYVFTIAAGNYTAASLATAIQTGMNASPDANVYVVLVDSSTYKMTISTGGTFSLNWATSPSQGRLVNDLIGWPFVDTAVLATHTAPNVVNLKYPANVLIMVDSFGKQGLTSSRAGYTFIVPILDKDGGSVGTYRELGYFKQTTGLFSTIMSTLTVELRDEDGILLDLNGANWSFVLGFN